MTRDWLYGRMQERVARYQRFTAPFDYSGVPTLSLPCGMTHDRLPLSLQLIGRHLSESLLIQAGYVYEQATSWHQLHPRL